MYASYSVGDNLLDGGDGNDFLYAYGATGSNTLLGGAGDDTIYGGSGSDLLTGGSGNDILYGYESIDTFAFRSYTEGVDSLYDFDATNETIQVSADGFGGGLLAGSLLSSQFTFGISATTDTQRFIFDNATGALYFDQDGNAGATSKYNLHNFIVAHH